MLRIYRLDTDIWLVLSYKIQNKKKRVKVRLIVIISWKNWETMSHADSFVYLTLFCRTITSGIGRFCSSCAVQLIIHTWTFSSRNNYALFITCCFVISWTVEHGRSYLLIRTYNVHTDEIWNRTIGKYYLAPLERTFSSSTDDEERATA